MGTSVVMNYLQKIFLSLISPSALTKAKRKLRCNIAASDHSPKLLHNIITALTANYIQHKVTAVSMNVQNILIGEAYIKGEPRRIINKEAEVIPSLNNNKIMCSVQTLHILILVWLIRAIAYVFISAFIDSSDILTKSVYYVIFAHSICESESVR